MHRWVLLITSLLLSSCSLDREAPAPPFPNPHVFLITIDTLRADRLSCYGYRQIETAEIDRLAGDGILFEQVVAPAPITLPSHASILTGLHPLTHGVRDNTGFVLPEGMTTLAEILSDTGYRSAAFVAAHVLDSGFGLDQGFDLYSDTVDVPGDPDNTMVISERTAAEVVSEAETWIRSHPSSRLFAWIHLFDPHAPYSPPVRLTADHPYDREVLYVDSVLGRFFGFLKKRGLYENSLVILTSDHGEGLGDHGEDTHGMFLYDSTLRVPLILKLPRSIQAGTRVTTQVQLLDIVPTLLELLEIEHPVPFQGQSLTAAWNGNGTLEDRPAYSEALLPLLNYGWSDLSSVRTAEWKWIQGPIPELFDLSRDPGESANLYGREDDTAERLSQTRDTLERQLRRAAGTTLAIRTASPETLERLRSLGYVGGSSPLSSAAEDPIAEFRERTGSDLADPKSKVHLFNQVWQAQAEAQEGRYERALDLIKPVLAEDSSIFMAHSVAALSLMRLERYHEAATALEAAVRLRPEDPGAWIYRGMAAFHLGQWDRAASSLEKALELDPGNRAARNNLATAYIRLNKLDRATDLLEQLAGETPEGPTTLLNLATLYLQQGRLDEARNRLEAVVRQNPSIPEAYNNLGLTLWRLGQLEEAETRLREAIRLRPDYQNAYLNLAEVLQARGREAEAREAVEKARALKR